MCYFCASVGYDFCIGKQFEQTTDVSIGFSRTSLQKKIFMKTFGVRIIEVRIIEDVLYYKRYSAKGGCSIMYWMFSTVDGIEYCEGLSRMFTTIENVQYRC